MSEQLIQELESQSIHVAKIKKTTDYQGQIDGWNRYMNTLDRMENEIKYGNSDGGTRYTNDGRISKTYNFRRGGIRGVTLNRNIKTNVPMYDSRTLLVIIAHGLIGTFFGFGALAAHSYAVVGDFGNKGVADVVTNMNNHILSFVFFGIFIATASNYALYAARRQFDFLKPNKIKLWASPKIHIDELEYARDEIQGIPIPRKVIIDPVIPLPKISIQVTRYWLGQAAKVDVMRRMESFHLP